jgi:hypothetical protein
MATQAEVLRKIDDEITDEFLEQNTAEVVRGVLKSIVLSAVNKDDFDTLNGGKKRVDFKAKDLITIVHGFKVPPITQVYDEDGYELTCQRRILANGNIEIEFSNPETGFIIY